MPKKAAIFLAGIAVGFVVGAEVAWRYLQRKRAVVVKVTCSPEMLAACKTTPEEIIAVVAGNYARNGALRAVARRDFHGDRKPPHIPVS